MTTSDPGTSPAGPQPDPTQQQPGPWAPPQQPGAWTPPQQPATTAGGPTKWLRIGVPVAVAGVVGVGSVIGFAEPEMGDCVQMQAQTSFDVVDCGSDEAEYRIVGVEDEEQNYPDFMADPDTCLDFASTEVALWIGDLETEPGTVYCAEPAGTDGP